MLWSLKANFGQNRAISGILVNIWVNNWAQNIGFGGIKKDSHGFTSGFVCDQMIVITYI